MISSPSLLLLLFCPRPLRWSGRVGRFCERPSLRAGGTEFGAPSVPELKPRHHAARSAATANAVVQTGTDCFEMKRRSERPGPGGVARRLPVCVELERWESHVCLADPDVRLDAGLRDPAPDLRVPLLVASRPLLPLPALGVGRLHAVQGNQAARRARSRRAAPRPGHRRGDHRRGGPHAGGRPRAPLGLPARRPRRRARPRGLRADRRGRRGGRRGGRARRGHGASASRRRPPECCSGPRARVPPDSAASDCCRAC